jgi:hypothetical protein
MEQHAYVFRGTLREFRMLDLLHRIPKPYNWAMDIDMNMDTYYSLGIIRFAFDRAATRDYSYFARRCVQNNGSVAKIRYFYSRHAAPSWSQEFPLPLRFAVLMHTQQRIYLQTMFNNQVYFGENIRKLWYTARFPEIDPLEKARCESLYFACYITPTARSVVNCFMRSLVHGL